MSKFKRFIKIYGPGLAIIAGTAIATACGYYFGQKDAWGRIAGDGTFQELLSHVVKSDDWTNGEFYDLADVTVKNFGEVGTAIAKDGVLNEESVVTHAIIFAKQ